MNTFARIAAVNLIAEELMKMQINQLIAWHAIVEKLHALFQEYLYTIQKVQ
jgi:hypothetical protein